MKKISLILFTICMFISNLSFALENEEKQCFPKCRDGYMCHQGACIQKCNPPCSKNETCSKSGQCLAKKTTKNQSLEEEKSVFFSIKGGMAFANEIHVKRIGDLDTESSYALAGNLDFILIPKLSMGIFVLMVDVVPENSSKDATLLSFGMTIKPRFSLGTFNLRPSLNIGYNKTSSDFKYADDVAGLNMGFAAEIGIPMDNYEFIIEPGFYSQPVGGNDDYTITFAPAWYLVFGFGK